MENMFDVLNYEGLSIRFDTAGNPEVDGFRLYVQLKSITDSTGIWPVGDRDRVRKEMVKLLKDVVRIRNVAWEERLELAKFVKVDIPLALVKVGELHAELVRIKEEEGKPAAELYYKKMKRDNPLLYFRHVYLWGSTIPK